MLHTFSERDEVCVTSRIVLAIAHSWLLLRSSVGRHCRIRLDRGGGRRRCRAPVAGAAGHQLDRLKGATFPHLLLRPSASLSPPRSLVLQASLLQYNEDLATVNIEYQNMSENRALNFASLPPSTPTGSVIHDPNRIVDEALMAMVAVLHQCCASCIQFGDPLVALTALLMQTTLSTWSPATHWTRN